MSRHRPTPKSLKRSVETRAPRKTIVIFCEGERTEPEYFDALRREPDVRDVAAVDIRIEVEAAGSVPLTLVNMAIDARERSLREKGEVDEFWCVFDVEWPRNHPALHEAITLATRNDIDVAISNPCFELWLALHFRDCRRFLTNDQARRLRRSLDGQPGKGLIGATYMPHKGTAARNAAALDKYHSGNGTEFPQDNPSSGMHKLIRSVTTRTP